jgi:colanic acid/amylovoran biosynthesis protein
MQYNLIVGAELLNKGAQAMLFVSADELKKRFPNDVTIASFCFCLRRNTDIETKNNFMFDTDCFSLRTLAKFSKSIFNLYFFTKDYFMKRADDENSQRTKDILENTRLVIDVSGYALSSQWGFWCSIGFLARIYFFHKLHIPIYIFPQSIGPFEYKGIYKIIIKFISKAILKYPKVIFARENEGYTILKKEFKLKNVRLSPDLVLLNKSLNLNNIYKKIPKIKKIDVASNSVAIIPNLRVIERGNSQNIYDLYFEIIGLLLSYSKKVYLMRHSIEDIVICEKLKKHFSGNEDVILIPDDLCCIEYHEAVKSFQYIIASRYHAIVHAYKKYVPSVVFGWAVKYTGLLALFEQSEYMYNIISGFDKNSILSAVAAMNKNHEKESEKIKKILLELQISNPFDVLPQSDLDAAGDA